jgi:diguanylate cyclase (GGDEF)-like protein
MKNNQETETLLRQIHSVYIDKIIKGTFVLSLLTLPISVFFLITSYGHNFTYLPSFSLVVSGFLLFLKDKISDRTKAKIISALFIFAAIISWYLMGIVGSGLIWFFVSCFILMTVYSLRSIIIFGVIFIFYATVVSILFVNGTLEFPSTIKVEMLDPLFWLQEIISIAIVTFFLITALNHFQKNLLSLIEQVDAQKKQLAYLANHDTLTNLPTLRLADERLNMAIELAKRKKEMVAVLFLDLDGFKDINDTYGHQAGDEVLKMIAERLVKQCRSFDTVCRVGGDEFLIVLAELTTVEDVNVICQRLIDHVSKDILFEESLLTVGVSIGVSLYPQNSDNAVELKKQADDVMYKVKKSGKNHFLIAES